MSQTWQIITGDSRATLATLPDCSVHCCVTSPPYWGLRDYGVDGQMGLEKSPAEFVAGMVGVFREVRRVLRDDATAWINIGDSYNSDASNQRGERYGGWEAGMSRSSKTKDSGLKPKDLCGVPWRLALALQEPYYAGRIKNELDRVWLAAMIEAEGCLFVHKRKAGQSNGQGYERKNDSYSPGLEVANTHRAIVDRCMEIAGCGSVCSQSPEQNGRRKQTIYRWNLRTNECRDIIREVYPYLIGKQHQARLLCGCPSSGVDAERAHAGLIALHNGAATDIDFKPPASMLEPGWYLRQDVIWSKCNPMPESVTDRCTKSHEYLFLLSKSPRYHYDAAAIAEPSEYPDDNRKARQSVADYAGMNGPNGQLRAVINPAGAKTYETRNARSVWTIATQPSSVPHYAMFPEELPRRCIKAGCPVGGVVLDPFSGMATTGKVAIELGRSYIGIELNPKYAEDSRERLRGVSPLLVTETVEC